MKPIFKQGNAVTALLDREVDFLIHVTNAQLKMGSGIAKEIRERVPSAYESYMDNQIKDITGCISGADGVINMTAQRYYGYDGKRYINYGDLVECLIKTKQRLLVETGMLRKVVKIGLPDHMDSDRAGGDWDVVMELVEGILGKSFQLVVYKL